MTLTHRQECKVEYTSVKIPKRLAEQIRAVMIVEGYTSVSDFVLDATRIHLRAMRKLY